MNTSQPFEESATITSPGTPTSANVLSRTTSPWFYLTIKVRVSNTRHQGQRSAVLGKMETLLSVNFCLGVRIFFRKKYGSLKLFQVKIWGLEFVSEKNAYVLLKIVS